MGNKDLKYLEYLEYLEFRHDGRIPPVGFETTNK